MKIRHEIAERGHGYYMRNKVSYICLDGIHGRAIYELTEKRQVYFDSCVKTAALWSQYIVPAYAV